MVKKRDAKKGDGILQWPSTDYPDIANLIGLTQPDFLKQLQSDYKQRKCYWCFTCEFVWEVLYHSITAASKLYFLKCKLVPSNRIKSKSYNVWALSHPTCIFEICLPSCIFWNVLQFLSKKLTFPQNLQYFLKKHIQKRLLLVIFCPPVARLLKYRLAHSNCLSHQDHTVPKNW